MRHIFPVEARELPQKGLYHATWNSEKYTLGTFSRELRKFFLGEFP